MIHGKSILRRGVLATEALAGPVPSARSPANRKGISLVNLALYPAAGVHWRYGRHPCRSDSSRSRRGWLVSVAGPPRCFSKPMNWLEGWTGKIQNVMEPGAGSGAADSPVGDSCLPAEPEAGISPDPRVVNTRDPSSHRAVEHLTAGDLGGWLRDETPRLPRARTDCQPSCRDNR